MERKQILGCGCMQNEPSAQGSSYCPLTQMYIPLQCTTDKEIIVQVSAVSSWQTKFLNLSELVCVLRCDPDLAGIDPSILPQILQTLYVVSGCDYISFFSHIGKATFLRYFYQYSSFITGGDQPNTPGILANTELNRHCDTGFLAFTRLIGTVYFKKNASGFGTSSPAAHFKKFADPGWLWMNNIQHGWRTFAKLYHTG